MNNIAKGKQKTVVEGLLTGFPASVYDPDLATVFKVTVDTGASIYAQILWLKMELKKWVTILNEKSWAQVLDAAVSVNKSNQTKLVLELITNGRYTGSADLHPLMNRILFGQVNRLLQELIMANFPPPFYYRDPLMKAGANIMFSFPRHSFLNRQWEANEIRQSQKSEVQNALEETAREFELELVSFRMEPGSDTGALLTVRLCTDQNIKRRHRIGQRFRKTLHGYDIPANYPEFEEEFLPPLSSGDRPC